MCDNKNTFKQLTKKLREILELENSDWAERRNEQKIEFKS
jgi:hypothetical protein